MTEEHVDHALHDIERSLLLGVLAALGLQMLNVQLFSGLHILQFSWVATLLIVLLLIIFATSKLRAASISSKAALIEPWKSFWPWIVVMMLVVQIIIYPPTMNDSLAYRLPRIFYALQDGSIHGFRSPDTRMTTMPWGWESLAMPFAIINWLSGARLINVAAWMGSYHLCARMALSTGATGSTSRLWALALTTAPLFLLQASSTANDLFASAMLLAGAVLIFIYRYKPGPLPVLGSLLALILASSAKPQFLTLGLPWLLWWAFSQGRPWKQVSWWLLLILAPLYLVISPIPQLATQYIEMGSLGSIEQTDAKTVGPFSMMFAGVIQFSTAQLQLPIMPGADSISEWISNLPWLANLRSSIQKFDPSVDMLAMIDRSGFGLIHMAFISFAVLFAVRKGGKCEILWLLAVITSFLLACSQIVLDTMGRTFAGYIVVLYPLACVAILPILRSRPRRAICYTAIGVGVMSMILNPAAPLWPASTALAYAEKSGNMEVADKLDRYISYQKRSVTGQGMLEMVPHKDKVGILIRPVTPHAALWYGDWRAHRIDNVHESTPDEFVSRGYNWLIVTDNAIESMPEAHRAYTSMPEMSLVSQQTYLPSISQGEEVWSLYRINRE